MIKLDLTYYLLILILINCIPNKVIGQTVYSGQVIDTYSKEPVQGAEVSLIKSGVSTTTDNTGWFSLTDIGDKSIDPEFEAHPYLNKIVWSSNKFIDLKIISLLGQETGIYKKSVIGSGSLTLDNLTPGTYLLVISNNDKSYTYRITKVNHRVFMEATKQSSTSETKENLKNGMILTDTLIISKSDYYTQKYICDQSTNTYEILKTSYSDIDYLDKLIRPEAFKLLRGLPLNPTFGEVKSVKLVYSINDGKLYYSNSAKYSMHYNFCVDVLGYSKSITVFNQEQYVKNPNRIYILATLNHFVSSDIYTLDFFPGDDLDCNDIELVYNKVTETFLLDKDLWFYANSSNWTECTNVPIITSDKLYAGQNYQPLNFEENYGYLIKVDIDDLSSTYLGRHDIVLINGMPLDIPVVAGIITTEFQTPLSHINVLSHNRSTPNMALRDGWTNTKLTDLENKLVYLKVSLDSFYIREATLAEAETFWAQNEPQTPHILNLDTTTTGLIDLTKADINSVNTIGGKAANFAELIKVNVTDYGPLTLPEGYTAIPFYYYHQHIKKYGLDAFIDKMLEDTLFQTNVEWKKAQLQKLRDSIIKSDIDTAFLHMVKDHAVDWYMYNRIRFRSSTNAEDIEGFNGAGLYDSYTGSLTDPQRPIDIAIKKVWASLWNFAAFEERGYFKIDHKTVAMGILVHRSFPDEEANGVVITKNLYNPNLSAITINVQIGEISVVNPEGGYVPDQILFYTFTDDTIFTYINHSNVPGMEGTTVLSDAELVELKKMCMAIHYHYCRLNFECKPMDIEFKVDEVNGARKIYIKQTRLY